MVEASSVPGRQLGRYLKSARETAGLTSEAAAAQMEWSKAKLYRVEAGRNSVPKRHEVVALCSVYGVSAQLTGVLCSLAAEAKEGRGWWHAYGAVIPSWFELFVGLESLATRMRRYDPELIPGLLQTREYATAVYEATGTNVDIPQAVEARMERQRLLSRGTPPAPLLDVIIAENALRCSINDRQAMGVQLTHLTEVAAMPNVTVRVLPQAVGPHRASVAGAFVLLDFPEDSAEPQTVYAENLTGALYLDKPDEVAVYEEVWVTLDGLALDVSRSRGLLKEIAKEYDSA
jgi:transcriptional regulator with XRE-family HTH domain